MGVISLLSSLRSSTTSPKANHINEPAVLYDHRELPQEYPPSAMTISYVLPTTNDTPPDHHSPRTSDDLEGGQERVGEYTFTADESDYVQLICEGWSIEDDASICEPAVVNARILRRSVSCDFESPWRRSFVFGRVDAERGDDCIGIAYGGEDDEIGGESNGEGRVRRTRVITSCDVKDLVGLDAFLEMQQRKGSIASLVITIYLLSLYLRLIFTLSQAANPEDALIELSLPSPRPRPRNSIGTNSEEEARKRRRKFVMSENMLFHPEPEGIDKVLRE